MIIYVKSMSFVKKQLSENPSWHKDKFIISICDNGVISPFPDRSNILKLCFDDVTEGLLCSFDETSVFFNEEKAKQIADFISNIPIDTEKEFFIHCAAGISRSGAVGYVLNEWFNKFKSSNNKHYEMFSQLNPKILPNPLVVRLLKNELFGMPFAGIEINNYEYDEDGNKIDHIELI